MADNSASSFDRFSETCGDAITFDLRGSVFVFTKKTDADVVRFRVLEIEERQIQRMLHIDMGTDEMRTLYRKLGDLIAHLDKPTMTG